jgi:hypothetical protein
MNLSFVMPGLDAEFVASPSFPDSIVKQPSVIASLLMVRSAVGASRTMRPSTDLGFTRDRTIKCASRPRPTCDDASRSLSSGRASRGPVGDAPQDEVRASVIARILCGAGYAVFPSAFALRLRRTFLFALERTRGNGAPSGATINPNALRRRRALRKRARHSALHRGFSVPGTVTSGREREGCALPDPGSFRRPSSAPRPALAGSPT